MPFTAAELAEMRRADEEIERDFVLTAAEAADGDLRDRRAKELNRTEGQKRRAEYAHAYYLAHSEQYRENKRAYYAEHREELLAKQRVSREANREEINRKEGERREKNQALYADRQRWLREERKARGWRQKDVAERIGAPASCIGALERGYAILDRFGKRKELLALFGRAE